MHASRIHSEHVIAAILGPAFRVRTGVLQMQRQLAEAAAGRERMHVEKVRGPTKYDAMRSPSFKWP